MKPEIQIDTARLKLKIKESGLYIRKIINELGVKYATFQGRVNGKSAFTAPEIRKLSELLHLTNQERDEIFFGD